MFCNKCGKEIPDNSKFCTFCGNKLNEKTKKNVDKTNKEQDMEKENNEVKDKKIKRSSKKIITVVIMVIALMLIIPIVTIISNKKENHTLMYEKDETDIKETYLKNQFGLFKSSNIIDEQFNDKGDLTYCKYYQGDTLYEDKFEYEYDNEKLKQIFYKSNAGYKFTLNINYNDNNTIQSIDVNNDFLTYSFNAIYKYNYFDNYIYVEQKKSNSMTSNISNNEYYIYDKTIDGKEYRIVVYKSYDKKQNASPNYSIVQATNSSESNYVIYEKTDEEYKNSFLMLGIIPAQYWNIMHMYTSHIFLNSIGFLNFGPDIINCGKIILEEEKTSEFTYTANANTNSNSINKNESDKTDYIYTYDEQDRIIFKREIKNSKILSTISYRYQQEDYGYSAIQLLYYNNQDSALAAGIPKGYYGLETKYKFYKNDDGDIYKIEELDETKYYTFEEASKLYEDEYADIVANNNKDELDIAKIMLSSFNELNINGNIDDEFNIMNEDIQNNTTETETSMTYNQTNNYWDDNDDDYYSNNNVEKDSIPEISNIININQNNEDFGRLEIMVDEYDYVDEFTVIVNGNSTIQNGYNLYSYKYNLSPGNNSFNISVTDKYGKTTNKKYSINFEPSQPKVSITKQGNSYGFFDVPESTPDYNKLKNLDIKVTCNGKSGTITYNEYYNVSEQEEEGENAVVFTVTNKYGKTYTTSYTYTK